MEPESRSSRITSWFPLFGGSTVSGENGPRSPISYLWRTSYRQSDVSSRKTYPDGRNEFMDLLRRTSGISSNCSDICTRLPKSALDGLSSDERDHIEKVCFITSNKIVREYFAENVFLTTKFLICSFF